MPKPFEKLFLSNYWVCAGVSSWSCLKHITLQAGGIQVQPPQLAPFSGEEQGFFLLMDTIWRKLISNELICDSIISVTTFSLCYINKFYLLLMRPPSS